MDSWMDSQVDSPVMEIWWKLGINRQALLLLSPEILNTCLLWLTTSCGILHPTLADKNADENAISRTYSRTLLKIKLSDAVWILLCICIWSSETKTRRRTQIKHFLFLTWRVTLRCRWLIVIRTRHCNTACEKKGNCSPDYYIIH